MEYQYWVIRYVPNVARGEFSNIGIVCGQTGGDWAVGFDTRATKNRGQLSSDLGELNSWVNWFRRTINDHRAVRLDQKNAEISSAWIEHMRVRQANSIQFSAPAPVQVESARAGVELLFPHLVEREHPQRRRSWTRANMRSRVRETFVHELNFHAGSDLLIQPRALIGKQRGTFDFARNVSGGERLTNVWAFNVAQRDVLERDTQAWNFLVSRFRQDGAMLGGENEPRWSVQPDAPVEVVYDPPNSGSSQWRLDIFDAAVEAWNINEVDFSTYDEFTNSVRDPRLMPVG